MQQKGFIKVITYALILICAFYLSFTFVSNHYQNIAEKKALAAAGLKAPAKRAACTAGSCGSTGVPRRPRGL